MNVLIAALNSASNWWAAWLLAASLEAVLPLAMVGLVWLALHRRAAPQVGYCLFLLVPLKLLVPVVVTVPASVAPWTPAALVASWLQGDHAGGQIEQKGLDAAEPAAPSTDLSKVDLKQALHSRPVLSEATTGLPGSRTEPSADRVPEGPRFSLRALIMMAWLGVVVVLLGRLTLMQLRFRSRLRCSTPLNESSLAIDLRELCQRAGVSETIRIVEADALAAPAVWGIFRPTIILPRGDRNRQGH
ncbi:MAG: M56 family metallopeptidase [Isosphaeraceae bacterium]